MSRFVSAGGADYSAEKEDAWKKAQQEIEASKKHKAEVGIIGSQEGGKSLYDVLQANKAAKQEAFEQSISFRNQLQSLNEEDADYLESVAKIEQAQKAAFDKTTSEQVAIFRKQQEDAEKAAAQLLGNSESAEQETKTWAVGKKRKKSSQDREFLKGIKLRKASTEAGDRARLAKEVLTEDKDREKQTVETQDVTAAARVADSKLVSAKPAPSLAKLGLGAYSSDEDD